ncbi:MAG TPA: hypothetical protein VLE51_02695 [Candidatus Saccharimonadales bacterium]|nr:hypothetical protein [Candidatus Saccharimonadales bacterium]
MNWKRLMENTNWLRQASEPLFPDLLWSRPENKRSRGKLLIIGGNLHGFAAPVAAYNAATAAGIGTARVILPEVLKKALGTSFAEAEFAPNTPSGSLARKSLDSLLDTAKWADGVLLAGDFGRNSETAILLSSLLEKYEGQVTVAQDGLDYFLSSNSRLLNRPNTLAVINMGKLQKLAKNNNPGVPIRHGDSLYELVQKLSDWSQTSSGSFITRHENQLVAATDGKVSTTPWTEDIKWQIELAAYASVWLLQNPQKPFEDLTTAAFEYISR